jgi:hypothetical protein
MAGVVNSRARLATAVSRRMKVDLYRLLSGDAFDDKYAAFR